jgi:hypothetical protein
VLRIEGISGVSSIPSIDPDGIWFPRALPAPLAFSIKVGRRGDHDVVGDPWPDSENHMKRTAGDRPNAGDQALEERFGLTG